MVSNSGFTAARLECSGCGDDTVTISAVCLARAKPVFLPTGSVMTTASLPRIRKQLCPYQRNSAIGSQSFQCPAQGMRAFRHRAAAFSRNVKTNNGPDAGFRRRGGTIDAQWGSDPLARSGGQPPFPTGNQYTTWGIKKPRFNGRTVLYVRALRLTREAFPPNPRPPRERDQGL